MNYITSGIQKMTECKIEENDFVRILQELFYENIFNRTKAFDTSTRLAINMVKKYHKVLTRREAREFMYEIEHYKELDDLGGQIEEKLWLSLYSVLYEYVEVQKVERLIGGF